MSLQLIVESEANSKFSTKEEKFATWLQFSMVPRVACPDNWKDVDLDKSGEKDDHDYKQ